MNTKALALSLLLCGLSGAAWAQLDNPAESSGFPGDMGRPPKGGLGLKPPPPGMRRPPQPLSAGPTVDVALAAAQAAVAACTPRFHVGVAVLDSSGEPTLGYTGPGARGSHIYMAERKALTALAFQRPNGEIAALAQSDPAVTAKITGDKNMVTFAGGVPLMSGGKIIGAIGVSGAEPSSEDEKCARAGIAAVHDRL